MGHSHLAELLDLNAELLQDHYREVISWIGSLVPDRSRIVDLGAGTGTGTLALAQHLPSAEVVAVDADDEMLDRVRGKATALGVADRVRTVRADLDRPWPSLGPADLIWASASLHHLADLDHAFAQIHDTLRPGGLIVVAEIESFPRFLTDPAGAALEERCHAAMALIRLEEGMHMEEDWAARLAGSGLTVEAERRFEIVLRPPLPAVARQYAHVSLERMRHGLEGRVSDDDLAALAALAPQVSERDDLTFRTTRTIWLARRP